VWSAVGGLITLVLYVMIASQGSRFFIYAKRSGLLELLLATPLSAVQIVHGQWRALLRMFAVPVVLYLAAQLLATVMAYRQPKDSLLPSRPLRHLRHRQRSQT
jgi:ABC-type Na+ efflux pump permease subunit